MGVNIQSTKRGLLTTAWNISSIDIIIIIINSNKTIYFIDLYYYINYHY